MAPDLASVPDTQFLMVVNSVTRGAWHRVQSGTEFSQRAEFAVLGGRAGGLIPGAGGWSAGAMAGWVGDESGCGRGRRMASAGGGLHD